MTTAAIRDRLLTYLADANDNEVKEFYSLIKGHIHLEDVVLAFTKQQLAILDARRSDLMNGTVKGIDRHTLHKNIRDKRNAAQ